VEAQQQVVMLAAVTVDRLDFLMRVAVALVGIRVTEDQTQVLALVVEAVEPKVAVVMLAVAVVSDY
jgi:hypothetical protein